MTTKRILFHLAATVFLVGCQSPIDEQPSNPEADDELRFYANVSGPELTRVTGTSWNDDVIGVFMTDETGEQTYFSNKRYFTPSSGWFSAFTSADRIEAPEEGETADIIAYYPFSDEVSGFSLPVDISNQTNQGRLDLLWSSNLDNLSDFSTNPTFSFVRRMVKISLNIEAGTKISSLVGMKVEVSGIPTEGYFDLKNGAFTPDNGSIAPFNAPVNISGTTATVEMTIMPEPATNPKIIFTLPGDSRFEWTVPGTLKSGDRHTFKITLNDPNAVISNPTSKFVELPASTSIKNTVFVTTMLPGMTGIRNYSMLYDTEVKIAYYVAYPLHRSYTTGGGSRTDRWAFDPNISQSLQPSLSSGFPSLGYSGIDRGHQLPSADRLSNDAANATTFYYTNMTPQNARLNQGLWNNLEGKVRTWMGQCDTLYVVTGAMSTEPGDMTVEYLPSHNSNKIAVPKYYFKALAKREGDTYYTIAFKVDNEDVPGSYDNYRLTVKELETATGFTFFPSIDASVKNTIQADRWQ